MPAASARGASPATTATAITAMATAADDARGAFGYAAGRGADGYDQAGHEAGA